MRMKRIVWVGMMAFLSLLLLAQEGMCGGEIAFYPPVKFQVDARCGSVGFHDIAAGDVDGDGDVDLIMIKNIYGDTAGCGGVQQNQVRVYFNQKVELGTTTINDLFYPPPCTTAPCSPAATYDGDGGGRVAIIYADGVKQEPAPWGNGLPYFNRYNGGSGSWTCRTDCCDSLGTGIPSNDVRGPLVRLAVAYKTISGKRVVDYILVARQFQGALNTFYSNASPYYAGRIIHLQNPYAVTGNPADSHGPWYYRYAAGPGRTWSTHPGHLNNFTCSSPRANFYRDDYAWKVRYGDVYYGVSFNAMELADLDGNGYYDLYTAPRQYHTVSGGGSGNQVQYQKAVVYRYPNPNNPSTADGNYNNFGNSYDESPESDLDNNRFFYDGSSGATYTQFWDFHMADMDGDGKIDLLGHQGAGSAAPLSWIKGNGDGTLENKQCKNAQLPAGGTIWDVWAGHLRGKPGSWPDTNPKGAMDLICIRNGQPQIDFNIYNDQTKAGVSPGSSTYTSMWTTLYRVPDGEFSAGGFYFDHVITADVDNDGENEVIALTTGGINTSAGGRAAFWIFKKNTTLYLTMDQTRDE